MFTKPHTTEVGEARQPTSSKYPSHEDEEKKGNIFAEEPFLQIPPTLACVIGLNEAIVFQYLHWLLKTPNSGKVIDGHKWIWNTYEAWQKDHFPWWSIDTIKRIFQSLETRGAVISIQPEKGKSRIKYYRTDKGALKHLTYERCKNRKNIDEPSGQDAPMMKGASCIDHNQGKLPSSYNAVITQKKRSNAQLNRKKYAKREKKVSFDTDAFFESEAEKYDDIDENGEYTW